MVSTVGWQAASPTELPSWMGWYAGWAVGWRLSVALLGVATAVAAGWLVSVKTASRYEARESTAQPEQESRWALTDPGFWKGERLVRRQRSLHVAAACAATALIAALPAERLASARLVALVLAASVLVLATALA